MKAGDEPMQRATRRFIAGRDKSGPYRKRYLVQRLGEADWKRQSPTLILRPHWAELHIPQVRKLEASKVMERKQDPDLVTVAVDLNVRNLASASVR